MMWSSLLYFLLSYPYMSQALVFSHCGIATCTCCTHVKLLHVTLSFVPEGHLPSDCKMEPSANIIEQPQTSQIQDGIQVTVQVMQATCSEKVRFGPQSHTN
jgi:hypothetical protein